MGYDGHLVILDLKGSPGSLLEPEGVKEIREFIDSVFSTFTPGERFATTGIRVYVSFRGRTVSHHHNLTEQDMLQHNTPELVEEFKMYLVRKFEIELNNLLEKT